MKILSALVIVAVPLCAGSSALAATTYPHYVAVDYNVPGHHPPLTTAQVTRIRQVLARVKPCQRPLVNYAVFSAEDAVAKDNIALFFWTPDDEMLLTLFSAPGIVYRPRWDFPRPSR